MSEAEMVEVKTADLIGPALDWAVAQICIAGGSITSDEQDGTSGLPYFSVKFGKTYLWGAGRVCGGTNNKDTGKPWVTHGPGSEFSPSNDWGQGGPLIDKHMLNVKPHGSTNGIITSWSASMTWPCDTMPGRCGKTPLVAVCRAIVTKELGETMKVPKELMQ